MGVVDAGTLAVTARYPLGDKHTPRRAGDGPQDPCVVRGLPQSGILVMMNADTGAVLDTIPIGLGNDGVVFKSATREIFASQGDGTWWW